MKYFIRILLIVCIFISNSGFKFRRVNYEEGRYKNVCKDLKGNVLVYFIFVDSKETSPWTEFDIKSTIDSMEVAIRWIEMQARQQGISLNILADYYIGDELTTVRKNLTEGSVEKTLKTPNFREGLTNLNKWADNIAKKVGMSFNITEKDGIPEIKNPKNKERLIAFLRDENNVESVALLYMVNNYYRDDISIAVNTLDTYDVEYAIVSYKYPSIITNSILRLYGAADLCQSHYRRNLNKIRILQNYFPDDVMQDVYGRNLDDLKIGDYTKYLIGWDSELSPSFKPLLTDKIMNF